MSNEGHIQILSEREVHAYELGTRPEVLDFIDSHDVWLAGLVEIGGYLGFNNDSEDRWYPRFILGDNDRNSIETLAESLDAKTSKDKLSESWRLFLFKSGVVAYLADAITPHAPSRTEVVTAIQNWEQAENTEERAEIAELYRENLIDRYADLTPRAYAALVEKPEFCAGVFDGRQILEVRKDRYPHLKFPSVNQALLEAFRIRFGGYIYIHHNAGEEGVIKERTFITRRDSLWWKMASHDEVSTFLKFIEPQVLLKRPDLERALALLE